VKNGSGLMPAPRKPVEKVAYIINESKQMVSMVAGSSLASPL